MSPLLVFFGGGLGSLARWAMNEWLGSPISTMAVNWLGSFAIGILLARLNSQALILLFVVGFLGGFTTFSGFSMDLIRLFRDQSWWWQYMMASVVGSVFLCALGHFIGMRWIA